MEHAYRFVKNYEHLVRHYGEWPSFHDAEVISLSLNRTGPKVEAHIYLFKTHDQLDSAGRYARSQEVVVTFAFSGVFGLELADFNEQNVLSDLSIESYDGGLQVTLSGVYGLTGNFICKAAEIVAVTPVRTVEGRTGTA